MLAWIKARLRDHFGFSKAETNGTLVLLLLMLAALLTPWCLRWYYSTQPDVDHTQDIVLLERILASLEAQNQPRKPNKLQPQHTPEKRHLQPIRAFDINTANEAQLSTIRGIGPVLSARIVKFRNKLGGFVSQVQYVEVYGLPLAVVERLQQYAHIKADFLPTLLNINTATAQTLAAHPYLTYAQAESIVRYREQHGPFTAVEALQALPLINEAALKKVRPYLTVSHTTNE